MGKLSAIAVVLDWLKAFFAVAWRILRWLAGQVGGLYVRVRNWLRVHVPFVEVVVQRHIHNPATIFIDIALAVLVLYLVFGSVGYVAVYQNKSDSRFSENVTALYPLPAVKVNGSYVWAHKFLQRLRFLNTFNAQAPEEVAKKLPSASQLREQIVSGLIEDQIILIEATELGVRVTKEELDTAFEQQQKQTKNFEATLKKLYGMSAQEFKQVIAERILKEKVKAVVLTRVKVRHILTSTESAANQARAELAKKVSFEAVVEKYSQDTQTKKTGGDLGYWTKGELTAAVSKNFEDTAFSLKLNQISQPVQTKFGYHIIQVTDRNDTDHKTYAEWYQQTKAKYTVKTYIPI